MWKSLKLDSTTGEWNELGAESSLAACKANFSGQPSDNVFHFWDGEFPSDEAASLKLFEEVKEANNGRVTMLTVGAVIQTVSKVESLTSCSGNCFCVIAHGRRRCETYYCSPSGFCWWVDCGMGC